VTAPRSPILALENPIQNYAWGSRTVLSAFLGRPTPSARPEAELWIGAHPRAPSVVVDPPGLGRLDEAIESDPAGLLGPAVCERFGNQLPFLLKVLAAAAPLSIQAHPDHEQAHRGWDRENAEGVPLDAPHRNYRDPNHKPELVCALEPFVALKGFRPLEEIARNLELVVRPELAPALARLARERTPAALRGLFARLLTLDPDESASILRRAAREAARREATPAWRWVSRLLERYPGDAGVLAPLYLHLVTLAPEEALFLPAGELHTYLEGTALEIMANSDNVLRGGLTPKHVDAPELLATLVFEPREPTVLSPVESAPGERSYRTPAREFELALLDVTPEHPLPAGAHDVQLLLGLAGHAVVRAEGWQRRVERGQAVLVPASLPCYVIEGEGRLARARVPA
jgi:mannose-6-phosphate isomerase